MDLTKKTALQHRIRSEYYAHSLPEKPKSKWQTMPEHARQVAALAKERADKFDAGDLGEVAGLLHDLGKYSEEFQRKLDGAVIRVDHSTAGARVAAERFRRFAPFNQVIAYAVAGHHAGLANGVGEGGRLPLQGRLDGGKYIGPSLNGSAPVKAVS